MSYSEQTKREAVERYLAGETYERVGRSIGAAHETVRTWAKAAGVAGQGGQAAQHSPERLRAKELWREGWRAADIARELEISPSTIRNWVKEIKGGPEVTAERDAQRAVELYQEGETIEAVAKALGRGVNTVSGWLHEREVEVLTSFERRTPEERSRISAIGGRASAQDKLRVCEQCGEPYELPYGRGRRSRQMFCSLACSYEARRDPNKRVTRTCAACKEPFESWATHKRRFCSRACFHQSNPTKVGVDGVVLDSSWESMFWGLCIFIGIPVERFDRDGIIEYREGHYYGPDFYLPTLGLAVEVKGQATDEDPSKWAAWREQKGSLVVLDREGLDVLRAAMTQDDFISALSDLAGVPVPSELSPLKG